MGEEQDLVAPYKVGLAKDWGIKKFNLDDLYVRFFRLAERRIAEKGGSRGVVSFISNFSWTTEPSFVVLRKRLLQSFDKLWIENMHGNRNISEYAPDGRSSETVFAQKGFSSGIRQGVVISTWVKNDQNSETAQVHYCDDFHHAKASERRQALLHSLDDPQREARYARAQPAAANKYSLKPGDITSDYAGWPSVKDLAGEAPINGLMEKRGGALIDMDTAALATRMRAYFDKSLENETVHAIHPALLTDAARYDAKQARLKLLAREQFNPLNIVRYAARPFDIRHAYFSATRPLWNEPRPTLWKQQQAGNRFLACRPAGVAKPEGVPFMFTRCLGDNDALRGHAYYIPLHWHHAQTDAPAASDLFGPVASAKSTRANLSTIARAYLSALGLPDPDQDSATAELLWMHALAVGYSPAYLAANADGIAQDWPRIPLPATRDALLDSAALGREVAALLDTENPVPGVTSGSIRPALHSVAVVSRVGGGSLHAEEFALTAGWGSGGQGGVTMPGRGRLEARAPDATEQGVWGPAPLQDVYLNAHAYWKNVPQAVWDFTIGGYQVMKKWLSYREQRVLGRALTLTEVMEMTATARRLGALVLLQAQLDVNYRAAATVTWQAPASA